VRSHWLEASGKATGWSGRLPAVSYESLFECRHSSQSPTRPQSEIQLSASWLFVTTLQDIIQEIYNSLTLWDTAVTICHHHHRQNNHFSPTALLRGFWQIASCFDFFALRNSIFYRARSSALSPTEDLEDQVTEFMSPSDRLAQIYPWALGSLSVASYDSQSYCGGILTRLHMGTMLLQRVRISKPLSKATTNNRCNILITGAWVPGHHHHHHHWQKSPPRPAALLRRICQTCLFRHKLDHPGFTCLDFPTIILFTEQGSLTASVF
jgi:hypothetical protein